MKHSKIDIRLAGHRIREDWLYINCCSHPNTGDKLDAAKLTCSSRFVSNPTPDWNLTQTMYHHSYSAKSHPETFTWTRNIFSFSDPWCRQWIGLPATVTSSVSSHSRQRIHTMEFQIGGWLISNCQDLTKIQAEITEFRAQPQESGYLFHLLMLKKGVTVGGGSNPDGKVRPKEDLQETPDSLDKLHHWLVLESKHHGSYFVWSKSSDFQLTGSLSSASFPRSCPSRWIWNCACRNAYLGDCDFWVLGCLLSWVGLCGFDG